jgi:hypothetical protein
MRMTGTGRLLAGGITVGKKKQHREKDVIAVFTLSTGYKVPVGAMDVKKGGLTHLARALIGETVPSKAKECGWDEALQVLQLEVSDCLIRLPDVEKNMLLKSLIWESVVEQWGKLEKEFRKKQ